ncbi:hypothetical protein DFJ58DRAFT_842133 [Suillus subalutaceus]|uniref:uncharacterized protein n=1 Tax=Suillus subalutaceus TaxID=48586 RepID=UPI001B860E90|nr:uncharacterized protein DFJ58DRAFT_842133 [Suillus subalutaceus]KAG1851429.1 hypothetical protein DFJ58DRAFT_842133 [Suillus subalutaceus]
MSNIISTRLSDVTANDKFTLDLVDFANLFEYASSCLSRIHRVLEQTKDNTSWKVHKHIGMYLNWEAEAFTIPWITFCTGLSINPLLSHNLRYLIGLLAMKQLKMLESYADVYDSFMTLPVDPPATWMRSCEGNTYEHAWWLGPLDTKPNEVFFNTYPNCVEVKELFTEHFLQLPEGTAFLTPATLIEPKIMPVAQQVSTIHAEVQQEGNHLLKMIEDKVIEARIVAASLMQMDSLLGRDVGEAIAVTERLSSQGIQGHLAFDVSDVANIFEYAGSRLLAIWTMLESRRGVISAEGRIILNEYLNWEAENLHIFLGIFRTGTVRHVAKEMYSAFMNIPAEPSSAWVTSHVVQSYKFAWWNTAFDMTPNKAFIGVHPSSHELWEILFDHFGQLLSVQL